MRWSPPEGRVVTDSVPLSACHLVSAPGARAGRGRAARPTRRRGASGSSCVAAHGEAATAPSGRGRLGGTSSTTLATSPAWSSALPTLAPPATQPPGPGTAAAAVSSPSRPAALCEVDGGVHRVDGVADDGDEAGDVEPACRGDRPARTTRRPDSSVSSSSELGGPPGRSGCGRRTRVREPGRAAPRPAGRGGCRRSGGRPTRPTSRRWSGPGQRGRPPAGRPARR